MSSKKSRDVLPEKPQGKEQKPGGLPEEQRAGIIAGMRKKKTTDGRGVLAVPAGIKPS
jgi:hypothetical protein